MTLYSIFDREGAAAVAPVAVAEKFSWLAALLPPAFGLLHGLWIELLAFVVAVASIGLASLWLGAEAGLWLYALLALFIGFEAASFRRGALRRRGWIYQTERFASAEDMALVHWLAERGASS